MAKKQKCPEFENHERWLVSFADMMTLLFAVFVVLYALKEEGAKDAKIDQAAASIQEAFNEVMEQIPAHRRVGPSNEGFRIFEHMAGDQVRAPLSRKFPGTDELAHMIDTEMSKVAREIKLRLYGNKKFRELEASGQQRIISVHKDIDGFRIRLMSAYFFDPGSYTVKSEMLGELREVADLLKELKRRVTVEGHTDSIPPRGRLDNWDLSSLRASQVVKIFIEKFDYPIGMIGGIGFADTRPVADNSTAASRALNRRVEIKVHYDD